jgi:ABC-2 type transport system permease protein
MMILEFALSIILMVIFPVILAALLRRRFQVPWILFAIGMLTFIGSQFVHFPLNHLLMSLHILPETGRMEPDISLIQSALVLGLTAGLCEETARLIGFQWLKKYRNLEDGIMLGLGHGGVESMIFGGVLTAASVSSLAALIGTDLSALNLLPEQLTLLNTQILALTSSPLTAALSPLFERLMAILIHLILSVMVLQAFRRRKIFYYFAAVGYHLLIDASAVYASSTLENRMLVFPMLAILIAPGLTWLILLWRKEVHLPELHSLPISSDLSIFIAAIRKEIIQQWRTKRFLVVMAVFVLFGLTSPIAAKYTPEILKSFAGGEKFAGLIPAPTSIDALSQYIKNITQFGFILAVLLGMNAVAGEKESGTAAMVLSKPMPRWAFILSKFTAQSLVYASAFLVAGLGAYYYTVILFGPLDAAKFITINLLLLLWLLTYVGAALLGSVIGPSIAAAAGVGLGISVVIMLAGNIPFYGALTPGGLIAWATMVGTNSDQVVANAGTLTGALVLILICLLWSVALFERQEVE